MAKKEFETLPAQAPVNRIRSLRAAQAVHSGEVDIPYRCARCGSPAITMSGDRPLVYSYYDCVTCGRSSSLELVKSRRLEEVRAFILRGMDIT